MSEQLPSEMAHNESRKILNIFDDEALIYAFDRTIALVMSNNSEVESEVMDPLDNAVWDMPLIDSERAFGFFERVLDDAELHSDLSSTIAIGLHHLTEIDATRSLPLWTSALLSGDWWAQNTAINTLRELSDTLLAADRDFLSKLYESVVAAHGGKLKNWNNDEDIEILRGRAMAFIDENHEDFRRNFFK